MVSAVSGSNQRKVEATARHFQFVQRCYDDLEVRKFDHCNVPNYTQQILLLGNGVLQQDIPHHQRKQGKATHKM